MRTCPLTRTCIPASLNFPPSLTPLLILYLILSLKCAPPHRLMKNVGQQGILKGFLIKAFNVARFLMLIFHWFASIRQKGRKRVYRKRRPISQSLHRAGLAVPTVFLMSPAGFSKSFQREITHPLLFRDASLPALSMHCFLFHCLKLDSDHPCFLFQLVFPALWHLFGFHLFFSFSFTKKSKIPSQMSPKSLCVFAQNTWRSLRTTNYQQEQLNSFQNSLLSWRLCLPFILSTFKPILLKYLALPWAPFVCSCCLLHSGEPSISFWNKAASVQNQKPPHHSWWQENAVGIVICTQAFIPLRSTSVWNEWGRQECWLQKQLSSSGLFLLKVMSSTVTRK